ncbi:MAG: hypothetical protein GWO24_31840 [Akkermansiaceae bacterium]|nr:hypothetical protein [Akkermansiaceae bacterium]
MPTFAGGGTVRDLMAGRASAWRQVEPVDYTVTDRVELTARDANFKIEFPGKLTSLQGGLDLQVRNGEVTVSHATGLYTYTPISCPRWGRRCRSVLDGPGTRW